MVTEKLGCNVILSIRERREERNEQILTKWSVCCTERILADARCAGLEKSVHLLIVQARD